MQYVNGLRRQVRAALRLADIAPWWERPGAKQKAAQLAVGINVAAAAIALPALWNYTVSSKWRESEARAAGRTSEKDHLAEETDRLIVQMIVNDRRRERGLPPYPYQRVSLSAADEALFNDVERMHRDMSAAERTSGAMQGVRWELPVHATPLQRDPAAALQMQLPAAACCTVGAGSNRDGDTGAAVAAVESAECAQQS